MIRWKDCGTLLGHGKPCATAYRLSFECSEEFRSLIVNASESWRKGDVDEELAYKLERRIYVFFVSGLSVFESLGFCLYFGKQIAANRFFRCCQSEKNHFGRNDKGV